MRNIFNSIKKKTNFDQKTSNEAITNEKQLASKGTVSLDNANMPPINNAETPNDTTNKKLMNAGYDFNRDVAIEVKNVDLFYGDFQALKSVNMNVKSNEITAFIGPSGCGKSTLLKCFNRMNDLIAGCKITGEINIGGKNVYQEKNISLLRKEIGMVFQKPNPFPMSIYDNIAYAPRTFGVRKKSELNDIVEKALRGAAIWDEVKDRLNKSALGLSGGQQQRLCIARALSASPKVLLLDEPTSALDPISTNKIEELAIELKKDYTIVMVTHNMQQAARISDKTAFFLLGEVVEMNETEKLFNTPKDERTENYITGRFG